MGCGCGAKKANNVTAQPAKVSTQTLLPGECDITLENLNKWESVLLCVKANNSYQKIGISEVIINQHLGIVQSAKNYPNDYCFYKNNLYSFKGTLLPKIIENEPLCI